MQAPLLWFLWRRRGKAGQGGLGLTTLNYISVGSGVQGLTLGVWHLALGQLGQVYSGLKCESLIKEVVGGLNLIGCSRRMTCL